MWILLALLVVGFLLFMNKRKEDAIKMQKELEEAKKWDDYREKLKETQRIKILEFNNILDSLPNAEIEINQEADFRRQNMIDFPEVKLKNITKSTSTNKVCDFVVLDTETTGIKVGGNRIIEISAIRFVDFEPVDCMTTLINPKMKIPQGATDVNNITDEMVEDKPQFYMVKDGFEKFIGNRPIVGHNITFDLRHMFASGLDLTQHKVIYDTLELSKKAFRDWDMDCFKLDYLCDILCIYRDNAHRSLSDCLATGLLFHKIVDEIIEN